MPDIEEAPEATIATPEEAATLGRIETARALEAQTADVDAARAVLRVEAERVAAIEEAEEVVAEADEEAEAAAEVAAEAKAAVAAAEAAWPDPGEDDEDDGSPVV